MTGRLFDLPADASIAVVGNAPEVGDVAERIDRADRIVRFNNCHGFGGRTGGRITDLVLINVGGQMEEWLDDPTFLDRPTIRQAERLILPIDPTKAALLDPPMDAAERARLGEDALTERALRRLRQTGKPILLLPRERFAAAAADLGIARLHRSMPAPSTGYLAVHALLAESRPGQRIDLHGFGFEGWDGHDFAAEKRWFEAMHDAGRLYLHPLRPVETPRRRDSIACR